jgi:Uma2 family endonuclease
LTRFGAPARILTIGGIGPDAGGEEAVHNLQRYTPAEYLALERQAEQKSEYFDGFIIAMAGASEEHILIVTNVVGELRSRLKGRPCRIYANDLRLKVTPTGLYTYPDVVVVRGERRFDDAQRDTLLNPTLIVEVLSDSTEAYDRGDKFAHYLRLESLQEYVMIAQDQPRVERYARQGGDWRFTVIADPDGMLRLASLDCELPLREIYDQIEFPAGGGTPGNNGEEDDSSLPLLPGD